MSKFSDDTCEKLYELSLDGGPDDSFGSCCDAPCRWWGLMLDTGVANAEHAILTVDQQGFVEYEPFATAAEAHATFDKIVTDVEAEMSAEDPDDEDEDEA